MGIVTFIVGLTLIVAAVWIPIAPLSVVCALMGGWVMISGVMEMANGK